MKIKILLSVIAVLLLSINANAQYRNKQTTRTKVIYVDHHRPVYVDHHKPHHIKKQKVRYKRHPRKVIIPQRVVYVPRPGIDVYINKPGRINVGFSVSRF